MHVSWDLLYAKFKPRRNVSNRWRIVKHNYGLTFVTEEENPYQNRKMSSRYGQDHPINSLRSVKISKILNHNTLFICFSWCNINVNLQVLLMYMLFLTIAFRCIPRGMRNIRQVNRCFRYHSGFLPLHLGVGFGLGGGNQTIVLIPTQ